MMNKFFFEARQEVKRADHLIYVSLKYTRTIDVMNNILERFINTYDFIIDGMIEKAIADKKMDQPVKIPGIKVEKLKELYDDEELHDYLNLYLLFRKIRNAPQIKQLEFRRGVKLTCPVDNKQIDVTIDIITDYYKRIELFMEYIKEHMEAYLEEHDEDDYF